MSLQVGIFRSEVVGKDETLGLPVFDRAVTEEFLEKFFSWYIGMGYSPRLPRHSSYAPVLA